MTNFASFLFSLVIKITNVVVQITLIPRLLIAEGVARSFGTIVSANRRSEGIDLDARISNFPLHQASEKNYVEVIEKILEALERLKSGQEATLVLSSEELNTLRSKFHSYKFPVRTATSFHPPDYYTIQDSEILEKSMRVPMPTKYGYYQATISITYINSNTGIIEQRRLVEELGRQVTGDNPGSFSHRSLDKSKLIFFIFKSIIERDKLSEIIQSIKSVDIRDGLMYIQISNS